MNDQNQQIRDAIIARWGTPQPTGPSGVAKTVANWLPTIGAIGGTLIPGLGLIGGGALGSAGGEFLKEKLLGQNANIGEIGKQAVLGGVGGVAGKAIGGIAGKFLPKFAEAAPALSEDTAQMIGRGELSPSVANAIPKATNRAAAWSLSSVFDVPKTLALKLKPLQTAEELLKYKIPVTGPEGIGAWAKNIVSKVGSVINDTTSAIKTPINIEAASTAVKDAADLSGVIPQKESLAIKKEIMDMIYPQGVAKRAVGFGPMKISAQDAMTAERALEQKGHAFLFAGERATGTDQLLNKAKGNIFLKAARSLGESIDSATVSESILPSLKTPEVMSELAQIDPLIAKQVSGAKNVADLRKIMAPFTRAYKLADYTLQSSAAGLGRAGNRLTTTAIGAAGGGALGGLPGAVIGGAASPLIEGSVQTVAPYLRTAAAKATQAIGQGAEPAAKFLSNPLVAKTLGQVGVRTLAGGNSPNLNSTPTDLSSADNTTQPVAPQTDWSKAILADMALTGGKNLNMIKALMDLQSGGGQKLTTQQQQKHDSIQTALSSLDAAETTLVGAGGAKGAMGLTAEIPFLGQRINPQGAAYEKTKVELATQLAKAITGSSRFTQQVTNMFMASLPSITDTPQFAAQKLQNLRNALMSQANQFGFTDITQGQ